MTSVSNYGTGDATFKAAGGEEGIKRLVDSFYNIMGSNPRYQLIWNWHSDKDLSRDKLARFLCGWMGGPRRYQERYGPISIPDVHKHLAIDEEARDLWLSCMNEALDSQDYPTALIDYLNEQFAIPAEMIRRRCQVSEDIG